MGIIGGAFRKLFSFFGNMFGGLFSFLGNLFSSLFSGLSRLFSSLFGVLWSAITWVGNVLKMLFQGLVDILIGFFNVIYGLIAGLLYLLYMIGVLAVKLFLVIFETAKVLWSLIVGFGRTLASLHYTPQNGSGNAYSTMIGKMFNDLSYLQLDVVAYILLFLLWFITAISSIKLISSIRIGGD